MRCWLSLTAASPRPTRMVFGSAPGLTSTSTSTGMASMPWREKVFSFASMAGAWRGVIVVVRSANDGRSRNDRRLSSAGGVQFDVFEDPGVDELAEFVDVNVFEFFVEVAIEDFAIADRPFGCQIEHVQVRSV